MPALRTVQLSKVYGKGEAAVKALDAVSLEIHQGEFVAVVGPSGSGKTTLLALLATLLEPTSGTAFIDDSDLSLMREKERVVFRRKKIGFTFQTNNLLPYLTTLENVELMLRLNGKLDPQSRRRASDLLERLGLGDRMDSLPSQLSGGQQQRVAIARALVHDPSVVLADEPTANLDTERAYQVVETFANLIHEHNRAGIMVTHDMRMVSFADKVIRMLDGRIADVIEDRSRIEALAVGQAPLAVQVEALAA